METRDKNNLVTNSKESFTNHKEEGHFFWNENTNCQNSSPTHTHRKIKANVKVVYSNTGQTEVGSIWHVASQEVNHDWLTMMVPGSVAGHWLA